MVYRRYSFFNLKSWILNNHTLNKTIIELEKLWFKILKISFRHNNSTRNIIPFVHVELFGPRLKIRSIVEILPISIILRPSWLEQLILKLIKKVSNSIGIAVASADQSSDRRILLKDKHQSYRFRHFQDISEVKLKRPLLDNLIRF